MNDKDYAALVRRLEGRQMGRKWITNHRGPIAHPESDLQRACVKYARIQYPSLRLLLVSVPNGARVKETQARVLVAEGLVAGVADLLLFHAGRVVCIEMKNGKTGRLNDHQKAWRDAVTAEGFRYEVVRSFDEFKVLVDEVMRD